MKNLVFINLPFVCQNLNLLKNKCCGHDFGKKFARRPYENSLQPISNVIDNVTIETFRKNNPEINTKLIETIYIDTLLNFKDNSKVVMKALVDQALAKENQLLSAKYEDSSL